MTRTISAARNFHKQEHLVVSPMPYNLQLFFTSVGAVAVLAFGTWWGLKFKRIYLDPWPNDPKLNSVFMRMTASDVKPFYACNFIKENKLNISSTKSMTGHLLGAAGVIEAIAAILATAYDIVPPTINFSTHDPEIDKDLNFTFNEAQERKVNTALSNTFGFGGHNSSIIFKKFSN